MNKYLGIYLSDQLALGVLWRELARRALRANRETELGVALAYVSTGIAEDIETFRVLMRRAGYRPNPIKSGLAIAAAYTGRLKLNGRWTDYSPLSRFLELDILVMGIANKKQLWTNLRDLAGFAERMPDFDFGGLIERAERQRAELEPYRLRAGTSVLAADP